MVGKIQVSYSELVKQQKFTLKNLEEAYRHLSTGKSIDRPGDQVVQFGVASSLTNESFSDKARLQSLQSRISWYQSIEQNISHLQNILDDMLRLAAHSSDGATAPGDRDVYDANFQANKESISQIVDGLSGRVGVGGAYASMPLLMGSFIPMDLEIDQADMAQDWSTNLFTNFAPPGLENASVLEGKAVTDSQTSVKLPDTASDVPNYYAGAYIEITKGSGAGQRSRIASYDPVSKIATFANPLNIALKGSGSSQSEFSIDLEARFASEIWGADNRYVNEDPLSPQVFIPLTQAEIDYRETKSILNTDLKAYTDEEIRARQKLNIFDSEYGHIKSQEQGIAMQAQVTNAKDQLSIIAAKASSKLGRLLNQVNLMDSMVKWKDESIGVFEDVDMASKITDVQELTTAHQKILELSMRLSEAYAKLNDLIHNKGVR